MLKQKYLRFYFRLSGKLLPLLPVICLSLGVLAGCSGGFYSSNSKTADASDEELKQYAQEWREAKPSIDRLAELENDLTFLLAEVSKMSELDSVPGQPVNHQSGGVAQHQIISAESQAKDVENISADTAATPSEESKIAGSAAPALVGERNQCAVPFTNNYRKSIAFASFPRSAPSTSNAGALYKVDRHLPMLLSANMTTRHSTLSPIHMSEGLYSANYQGEARAAAQTQLLARKHRTQFIVSGEVKDMSMVYPAKAHAQGIYNTIVNGANNLFNLGPPGNTRSRIFSFQLQLRDGFTGQIVFDQYYETYGKWDSKESPDIGFGSPRFWQTDYGEKIQHLVAKASDELAATVHCNPYIARVDQRPGRQQVIIHSGASSGLRAGDALELYQLVVHPVTGEYDNFDTRLVNHNTLVYLTEVYPSHSVAEIGHDVLLSGQYLAMAP